MLEKIVSLIIIIGGAWAIITYLVPYLGAFAGIATIIIAIIAIFLALAVLTGKSWGDYFGR